jgi:hypothetical protein
MLHEDVHEFWRSLTILPPKSPKLQLEGFEPRDIGNSNSQRTPMSMTIEASNVTG